MPETRTRRVFRSLAWGYHAPGGIVLWWLIQKTARLHILGELPFEQMDERELAAIVHDHDRALGIGPHPDGGLLARGVAGVAYTVGTPEIVSQPGRKAPGFRGETIGDRLLHYGLVVIPADEDMLNGWKRCQSLLQLDEDGVPYLTLDPSCTQLAHAIQSGLQNPTTADNVRAPAPALTAFRYGAMTRPTPGRYVEPAKIPPGSPADVMRRIRAQRAGASR